MVYLVSLQDIPVMIIPANYHTHSRYDDGCGELEEYAAMALNKGLKYLGFSGHAPLPFETLWNIKAAELDSYLSTVRRLKQEYNGRLEILVGLEIDYIPEIISPRCDYVRALKLDYTLGSVHFLNPLPDGTQWTVDGTRDELERGLGEVFGGDVRAMVEEYYRRVRAMLTYSPPDIVGHIDLVKKNNRSGEYFKESETWYRQAVKETLAALKKSGSIMEINTGGLARNTSCALYPSEWILAECLKLEIPVMINSDAHAPEGLDAFMDETSLKLKEMGFTECRILTATRRKGVRL